MRRSAATVYINCVTHWLKGVKWNTNRKYYVKRCTLFYSKYIAEGICKKIKVFKPRIDNRYAIDEIASHSGYKVSCICIDKATDILKYLEENKNASEDEKNKLNEEIEKTQELIHKNNLELSQAILSLQKTYDEKITTSAIIHENISNVEVSEGKLAKFEHYIVYKGWGSAYEPYYLYINSSNDVLTLKLKLGIEPWTEYGTYTLADEHKDRIASESGLDFVLHFNKETNKLSEAVIKTSKQYNYRNCFNYRS